MARKTQVWESLGHIGASPCLFCWPDLNTFCVPDNAPARTRNRVIILAPAVVLRNWQVLSEIIYF